MNEQTKRNGDLRIELEQEDPRKRTTTSSVSSLNGIYVSKGLAFVYLSFYFAILLTVGMLAAYYTTNENIYEDVYVQVTKPCSDLIKTTTTTTRTTTATTKPTITSTTTIAASTTSSENVECSNNNLANKYLPERYELFFYDFDNRNNDNRMFTILANIYFKHLSTTSNYIHLSFDGIFQSSSSSLGLNRVSNGKRIKISKLFNCRRSRLIVFYLDESVGPNEDLLLSIKLRNSYLSNQNEPISFFENKFMLSTTSTSDNQILTQSILSTNFKPIYVRNVFPCFDEPTLKAKFSIRIEHPNDTIALSNYPIKSITNRDSFKITEFETTAKISTHSLGWLIAPDNTSVFDSIIANDTKSISVHARTYLIENKHLDFALATAEKLADYFKSYFINQTIQQDDDYFKKIDIIALPNLENIKFDGTHSHGLITIKEETITYSNKTNDLFHRQSVALNLALSISKMYLDKAAINWNDDFWFNEALAIVVSVDAINEIFPEFNYTHQHIGNEFVELTWQESFPNTYPIKHSANLNNEPSKIIDAFKTSNYKKAAAILRMIQSMVGTEDFHNSIKAYMNSIEPNVNVFLSSLTLPAEMKGDSFKSFVDKWTSLNNYPLVTIRKSNPNNVTSETIIHFKQEQFLAYNIDDYENVQPPSLINKPWPILLQCFLFNENSSSISFSFYLNQLEQDIKFNTGNDDEFKWIKCNRDFLGLYLIDYGEELASELGSFLQDSKSSSLDELDRANLIHDSFLIAFQDRHINSYELAFKLTEYLSTNESNYLPWKVFTWHINKIAELLEQHNFYPLSKYSIDVIANLKTQLDIWNIDYSTNHFDVIFKSLIIDFSCRMLDAECLSNSTDVFEQEKSEQETDIQPNKRFLAYKYHLMYSKRYEDWQKLKTRRDSLSDQKEKTLIDKALSSPKYEWILNNFLKEAFGLANNDYYFFNIYKSISSNSAGRYTAWYFMKNNYTDLYARNQREFRSSLVNLAKNFNNHALLNELNELLNRVDPANTENYLRSECITYSIENINWLNAKEKSFSECFLSIQTSLWFLFI